MSKTFESIQSGFKLDGHRVLCANLCACQCRADTLYLATCYFGDLQGGDGVQGTDASHRGGPPGFVQVSGPGTLRFADYVGNYTFTTLGEPCHCWKINPSHVYVCL